MSDNDKGTASVRTITAHDIELQSRHGKVNELAEMLAFAELLDRDGNAYCVESVFYDSGSGVAYIKWTSDDHRATSEDEVTDAANMAFFQWDYVDDDCLHHGYRGGLLSLLTHGQDAATKLAAIREALDA